MKFVSFKMPEYLNTYLKDKTSEGKRFLIDFIEKTFFGRKKTLLIKVLSVTTRYIDKQKKFNVWKHNWS